MIFCSIILFLHPPFLQQWTAIMWFFTLASTLCTFSYHWAAPAAPPDLEASNVKPLSLQMLLSFTYRGYSVQLGLNNFSWTCSLAVLMPVAQYKFLQDLVQTFPHFFASA